ncbi:hypothetical protein [Granulicella sp. S156]|uniref:hypothetical protein n=1 Tax=Granulicella sp. S156 TaxID=1747224 RepID=UPI00131CA58F|nr:hypothetical protein [Granulicella sp. S156]
MKAMKLGVVVPTVLLVFMGVTIGILVVKHQRHVRFAAEEGLRREIRENNDGVQELRDAIPEEIKNISGTVALLQEREAGHETDGAPIKIGIAVLSLTNANWQAATVTGAMESIDYDTVQRFAGAYFEQSRLAQLQTSTLESMMSLSSYVGHGEKIPSMSPAEARAAEIQAQALLAHLRMMSRMSDGVQGAYKDALRS